MSLLWRDELRVVLAPEQAVLVRLGRAISKRGLVRRVKAKTVMDCAPASSDDPAWGAVLTTLEAELPRLQADRSVAKVILSNHFMRYTMMPWSESLGDAAEEEAYARHCFRQLYGAAAEHWELRLNPEPAGLPQLVSAVDKRLLTALRGVLQRNDVAVGSIQPRLMAAYNNCRPSLHKHNAWFVLYEPGNLCLALLHRGRWLSVRTMRTGSDWRDTLSLMLEREACLVGSDAATRTVFLWAPELAKSALPQSGQWQIHHLHPVVRPAFVPEYEGRYAMALSG